ncbi:DUF6452 family protein [Abyssalbus ytuae]|uniref:DUF6452 family protein n=1 Tax=Abyssalbus ytuae TaxID=2926907 RepID=A0A9E7CZ25_9FLAO|nr:DUF6452 family protein [Abyssalbus ytuae]UOB17200.1 DUF6452 family protein [Abyssalbus ytuae]
MRKTAPLIIFTISLFFITPACEKDDICPSETNATPLLVITFYDIDDIDNDTKKKVRSLRVVGADNDSVLTTIADQTNLDSIGIPLKIFSESTSFVFINNSTQDDTTEETGNRDTLTFNYQNKEVFISRACGYANKYENLNYQHTDDDDEWIKIIQVANENIENQNASHVKIYH